MLGSARSVLMKTHAVVPSLPPAYASYNLNENTGTTAADSSGNSHPLTVSGASWVTGHTGSALSNTSNSTTGATSAALFVPSAAVTMMAWIKPLQLTAGQDNFAFGFFNGDSTRAAIFTQRSSFGAGNVLQFQLHNGGLTFTAGTALSVDTWTHVAATYDGASVKLYQDGIVTGSGTINGAITSSSDFYVAGGATLGFETQVVVDDVRIFDIALTQTQVTTAMSTPV